VSKEFNVWELRDALVVKDVAKANKILHYMEQNAKANPPVTTVSNLFGFFSTVMLAFYSPDRTEQGLLRHLELQKTWQLRPFMTAMRNFSALKTMQIIGKLREADARLKGIERGNLADEDIMHELVFFILH
jgi:DNA polymerase-3 subunit delta